MFHTYEQTLRVVLRDADSISKLSIAFDLVFDVKSWKELQQVKHENFKVNDKVVPLIENEI